MGLSFFEKMQGELVSSDGSSHAIDFDIKAEAGDALKMLRTGQARITGVVRAHPWAMDAALSGSITISPLRGRSIAYDLRFRDDGDTVYHLTGRKDLGLLKPMAGATRMRVVLTRGDEVVATGEMRFALRDLPRFLASWTPTSGIQRLDLGAPMPNDTAGLPSLSEANHATLIAYAEAIIAPGIHVPKTDEQTMPRILELLPHLPPHFRALFNGLLSALDVAARVRFARRFSALPLGKRRALLDTLDRSGLGAGLNTVLSTPVKLAHFSQRTYLDAVGVPTYTQSVHEPPPRYLQNVVYPHMLEAETTLPADVVIVGSGAGGAPMAALLAERGLAVAVVEAGPMEGRAEFSGAPEARYLKYWRDAGMTVSVGNVPMLLPTGRLVGGSTAINSGTCFSTPDAVLNGWCDERGLSEDFRPAEFERFLASVHRELEVKPADMEWVGDIAQIVGRGADAMGVQHGPLPRNATSCDGQGVCTLGCPTDAKRSTNVSYIPRALKANAYLFTGLPVTRVLRRGGRMVGVEARGTDQHGASRVLRIRARAVVLATGTFATPLLLRDNGIDLPRIGQNLSVHPALGMMVRAESIHAPWRAIPQSYGVEGFVDPRVRFEGFYMPPQIGAMAFPMRGAELSRWMDVQAQVGQYGFMVRDRNVGTVRRGPGGRPLIHYNITPDVLALFQEGAASLAELLIRGGADEVMAGVGSVRNVRTVAEARAIRDLKVRPHDFRPMAFHPLGTCRMGRSAKDGVVDADHRVFGTENLYVVDGSSVPTSLGVNPQITIMAMAERAAERLAARLSE